MRQAELIAHRRQTEAYIKVDPTLVEVQRQSGVSDGAGGFTIQTQTLGPQEIRLLRQSTQGGVTRHNENGELVQVDFIAIARHDADIQRFDVFILDGDQYRVVFIDPDRSHQVRAEMSYRGSHG